MRTSDFSYELPPELIAQTPIEPRDHSRLLVINRADGSLQHRRFFEIGEFLHPGDLLVFNDSRVIPARLRGRKVGSNGKVELLLLRPMEPRLWQALARPGRRLQPGAKLRFDAPTKSYQAEIIKKNEDGTVLVTLEDEAMIEACGQVPLPPYIHERLDDPERYQTVYAREKGSVAAPTAGLHFTQGLLERLRAQGVGMAFVTLHIGLDTFKPVDEEDPREHRLHSEFAILPEETAQKVNETREKGGRVVAVGTTAVRTLESAAKVAGEGQRVAPYSGWTEIMILPGHEFKAVDAIVTNFHLPRSTLLMLMSAFAGKRSTDRAYAEAVKERYRFYSFGDAMAIL